MSVEIEGGHIQTKWSVDLERAVIESKVSRGDKILLKNLGKIPVTIQKKVYSDDGSFELQSIEIERNTWVIEKLSALTELETV